MSSSDRLLSGDSGGSRRPTGLAVLRILEGLFLGRSMFPFWSDVPLSAWLQISAMFVAIVFWMTGFLATTPARPQ